MASNVIWLCLVLVEPTQIGVVGAGVAIFDFRLTCNVCINVFHVFIYVFYVCMHIVTVYCFT